MNIHVTSLTDHRIDILFADYISKVVGEAKLVGIDECDLLIVTNGMYDSAKKEVLQRMKEVPSIYTIDDHTCWVPTPDAYGECTILSQFVKHPTSDIPMVHFPIAKLAIFDERFEAIKPILQQGECIYWGKYKPERYNEYHNYLPNGSYIVGKDYPVLLANKEFKFLPFTKDMTHLHDTLSDSKYASTYVFGDEFHNGVNLPYRIYEALMCGIIPEVSIELIGGQELDIDLYKDYLSGDIYGSEYAAGLKADRASVIKEFMSHIDIVPAAGSVHTTEDVDIVLAQRGALYGSYSEGVYCRADIMKALANKYEETHGYPMPTELVVMLSDIVLKLMRVVSDPTQIDSWVDLEGYAKLCKGAYKDVINR